MGTYNLLKPKSFHGVSSGNQHPYLLKSRYGKVSMDRHQLVTVEAEPYPFELVPAQCTLLIIDMQRDFLEAGGFGEMLGNDVSRLRRTIEPNRRLLAAWRTAGLQVMQIG